MSMPPRWSVTFTFSKNSVTELKVVHLAEETDHLSYERYQPRSDDTVMHIYVFDNIGDAILFLSSAAYECRNSPPDDLINAELVDYEVSE